MAPANRPNAGRPNPDALLAAFRREAAGRLKVFLGAAPGVGKTYAMLQNARRLKDEGVDVVIGLVEAHGRAETSALETAFHRACRSTFVAAACEFCLNGPDKSAYRRKRPRRRLTAPKR